LASTKIEINSVIEENAARERERERTHTETDLERERERDPVAENTKKEQE